LPDGLIFAKIPGTETDGISSEEVFL